jgi:hypothetical protein
LTRIYNKARWRRLRLHKLSIDPLCACGRPAAHVDHVLRISAGGDPWDMRNLDSKCHACHSLKTNAEKSGREWVGSTGKDGLPVGGDHWWGKLVKNDLQETTTENNTEKKDTHDKKDMQTWHFE